MTTHSDTEDRRQFSRIAMDADVHLHYDRQSWPTRLIDISLKGALISKPPGWQMGPIQSCVLEVQLDWDATIRMTGAIAHIGARGIGFRCQHIDIDSISHLKRLVELNLGDGRLLGRELAELL